jgi:hypothetical protein
VLYITKKRFLTSAGEGHWFTISLLGAVHFTWLIFRVESRVARFFMMKYTKMGDNYE